MDYSKTFRFSQSVIRCAPLLIIWIIFIGSVAYCESNVVTISEGLVRGKILSSRDGRQYYSYTAIPYAKPPIGELRFKMPEPAEPWEGILDATNVPNKCVQMKATDGREDCLYLNVYSPKVDKTHLLPVMFWIHGGKFSGGHGGPELYGPEYLMDKDVLLVSINYRLGLLGFLSTEDDVIPGNFGLKDQVMALRWVQRNIARFNGDPSRVTIFGESAGAASVGFHMLSPMSRGLFHKAILQSGTPVCMWAVPPPGLSRKRAHSIAINAGCNYEDSEGILECLRNISAEKTIELQTKLYTWFDHPFVLFNPVVESCGSSADQDAFMCRHPIYDFKQESFVPAIIGLNSAEGGIYVANLYNSTSLTRTEFGTDFNRLLSLMLFYNQYTRPEVTDEIGELVFRRYFPSYGGLDDDTHSNAVNMFSDGAFTHCIMDMIKKLQLSSPVYSYFYDYQNEFSFNKLFGPCSKSLGVTHADELNSLFKNTCFNPNKLNVNDLEISKLMVNIWYKFVSSETPTIDGTDSGTAWPKCISNENCQFLHVDSALPKIIENPFEEIHEFWSKLPYVYLQNQTATQTPTTNTKTEL